MEIQARIPFHQPQHTGNEAVYIQQALLGGRLSGDGGFTHRCQAWLQNRYGYGQCLLTHSCSGALEMAALVLGLGPADEVIVPSFTFVTTASSFALRGARLRFCDCEPDYPNISPEGVERLITPRTRAIVAMHYGGVGCDMEALAHIAQKHGVYLIEDAAHAIHAQHNGQWLGSFGHLATLSFHESKNLSCGEGGALVVNDPALARRAEIIWEKGTNRAAFMRGESARYEWMALGGSFAPSELVAACLLAQLEEAESITQARLAIWQRYWDALLPLAGKGVISLPYIPARAGHNAHIFFFLCKDNDTRNRLLSHLKARGIHALSHYLPLEKSPYFHKKHGGRPLPHTQAHCDRLVRLPLYPALSERQQGRVVAAVNNFFNHDN